MSNFNYIYGEKKDDKSPNPKDYFIHMHNNYEIFYFLEGNAKYIVEGIIYSLHPGDFVLMRPGESHHIHFISDTRYRRMVVNFTLSNENNSELKQLISPFNERPLGKYNHYPASFVASPNLSHYIEQICLSDNNDVNSAYLTVFLNEILPIFNKNKTYESTAQTTVYAEIIRYINAHITEELSLDRICEHFFISKSQLNRNFKKIIGSTVWEYITKKRLIIARKQIENGKKPTQVYLDCGFNEYTSFYRAYLTVFGFPPSETMRYFQQQ